MTNATYTDNATRTTATTAHAAEKARPTGLFRTEAETMLAELETDYRKAPPMFDWIDEAVETTGCSWETAAKEYNYMYNENFDPDDYTEC